MPCMRPTPDEIKQGEKPTQPKDFTLCQADISRQKEHYTDNGNKHTRNHNEHNKSYNNNKRNKRTDKNKKTVITIMP